MTEYINKAQAAAEITRAYYDGRINTLEEILGVLDLLPGYKAGQAGAGARDEAKGEADQGGDDAVLYAVVKGGSEAVNVSVDVYGSVDSALVGLAVLISDVADRLGRDFVQLCQALAAHPPTWIPGGDHQ